MSTESKHPVLVTVAILTAIVGLVTAVYKCGTEQQNFINSVSTPSVYKEKNDLSPATNTDGPAIPVPKPPPPPTRTTVTIVYQGDQYGCSLPITITIGDRTFQPTSNAHMAYDIPLGNQQYRMQGNITCTAIGGCSAYGDGFLNIRENTTFAIRWQNTAYAQCSIGLFEL
jgi:hypothetical protein